MGKNGWNEDKSYENERVEFRAEFKPEFRPEFRKPQEKEDYKYEPNEERKHEERKHDKEERKYDKKDDCCCVDDFEKLFNLLATNDNFRELLDGPATFGFIGDTVTIGATLQDVPAAGTFPDVSFDDIAALEIDAICFDPCTCGIVSLPNGGNVYTPVIPAAPGVGGADYLITRVSLCNLAAFGIDFGPGDADGDITTPAPNYTNYRRFKETLDRCVNEHDDCCQLQLCKETKCEDCCCNQSILNQLNCMGGIDIVAGLLDLRSYNYFGQLGNIAIFNTRGDSATTNPLRFFFVCLDSVFGF